MPSIRFLAVFFLLSISLVALGCGDDSGPATDAGGAGDTGLLDAEPPPDGAARCTASGDCDDGIACNGTEPCGDDGFCRAGTPPDCDDGVACTDDTCSEAEAGCVNSPPDGDGDGHGASTCIDMAGAPLGDDCDDADAARYPGAPEVCDSANRDEDCDPATIGSVDSDRDGVASDRCCNRQSDGTLLCGEDCDDLERDVAPGATEACDGLDNGCNGMVDEGVAATGFADADHDGHGDPDAPVTACAGTPGFSPYGDDCDDTDPLRSPGVPEVCDDLDNDCNGAADDGARFVVWFRDADGDGFGSVRSGTRISCEPPAGYSLLAFDCNDTDALVSPVAAERCNGVDDDCDGEANFAIGPNDSEDDDDDGVPDEACTPAGADCDDDDASSRPGAPEVCEGRDNDCDRSIDEDTTAITWYRDMDGDGHGDDTATMSSCVPPVGHASRGGDCEDASRDRNPGAFDDCDGTDDDCSGDADTGFDLMTDPNNCGACARACLPGEECSSGVCGVPTRTCGADADCEDLNPCTMDRCVSGTCSRAAIMEGLACPGTPGICRAGFCCPGCWDGTRCRSGLEASACGDDGGTCTSCTDALSCTTEACNAATHTCTPGTITGCFIAGACWDEGASNPMDPCSECNPIASSTAWSPRADGGACSASGAPGQCRSGACCIGCWNGTSCQTGTALGACGNGGGPCTSCNDGLGCTSDGCDVATRSCSTSIMGGNCVIDGACWASGTRNPVNNCQACSPSTSQTAWADSVADAACVEGTSAGLCKGPAGGRDCCIGCWDGTACRTGDTAAACGEEGLACSVCSDGLACTTERCDAATRTCTGDPSTGMCAIAGACWADGATNPTNPCQSCDADVSGTGWTDGADGAACIDGASPGACRGVAGSRACCSGCWNGVSCLGGTTTAACGVAGTACGVCDDRITCTVDSCAPTGCATTLMGGFCRIAGACYTTGARNPANDCQVCNPALSTSAWTELADMSACNAGGTGGLCRGAAGSRSCCTGCWNGTTCTLGDTAAACGRAGASCAVCTDALSCTTDVCTSPFRTCTNTIAAGNCLVGGICYPETSPNPANDCQSCQSATSNSTFTNVTPGTTCFVGAMPGSCRGTPTSSCCTGCWDGAACTAGGTVASCGGSGNLCQACACDMTDTCIGGSCLPSGPTAVALGLGGRSGSNGHACIVRSDGQLWCWGANAQGQFGNGTTTGSSLPIRIGTASNWARVATGNYITYAVRTDGSLYSAGYSGAGEGGHGDTMNRTTLTRVGMSNAWTNAEAAGTPNSSYGSGCGLQGSSLYCWGYNGSGNLGLGDTTQRLVPTLLPTYTDWELVDVMNASFGGNYQMSTCAIRAGGLLYCWGENDVGQLGLGDTTQRTIPTRVGAAINWDVVRMGGAHTCGIRAGTLWCWGRNTNGQLGLGDTVSPRTSPVQVGTDSNWADVDVAFQSSCGIKTDGSLWCWGYNNNGQLGTGTTTQSNVPVRVGTSTDWQVIELGEGAGTYACGIRTDGTLWCWGSNTYGNLGTGDTANRLVPTRICLPP